MSDGNQRLSMRIQQYRLNRRKFSLKVYTIAFVFALLTVLQWLAILFVTGFRDSFIDYFYISAIFLFFALITITMFVFVEHLRFRSPVNWLLSLLIVEFVTYGLARIVAVTDIIIFAICILVTLVIVACFVLTGIVMSHDLTLDVVILFLCSIIFFIGSVFFVILFVLVELPFSMYIYCGFVIAAVVSFIMYHAQTINGNRYAEMRLNDYWLAALIIYHDFVIMFAVILYITSSIWPEHRQDDHHK